VYGVHHKVSQVHLHPYVDPHGFLYNTRDLTDDERLAEAIRSAGGRRLTRAACFT
jgi:hypothetical protein